MRVRSLAAALGAAVMLCTAAPARADVEELGRTQYLLFPAGESTSWEPPSSPNPNQTWIVGVSQPAGISTASLTYGDRALTLERAVTGPATRTEFWSLTNPEQVPGRLFRLVNSAAASPRISLFRFAGVDTTAPVLATEVSQGSGPGGQTALTGSGTPSDVQIGLFTHANGNTSTGLGFTTPDGAAALGTWNLFSLTPMRVAGMIRRGPQQGVTGGDDVLLDGRQRARQQLVRRADRPALGALDPDARPGHSHYAGWSGSRTSRTRSPATAAAGP